MTDLKPKIFIGSSSEALPLAVKVKKCLNSIADSYVWNEPDVFEPGRSIFDNLLRMTSYYDFGIFLATADDLTLTKDKLKFETRDNVILEMSMFLGSLGPDKSFLLVEEGVKLPSDFSGIFMPRFKKDNDRSLKAACKVYQGKIEEYYKLGYLSLYPTTSLAIGYYKNFVQGLVNSAVDAIPLTFDGVEYSDFKLRIVLPHKLRGGIRELAETFYRKHGFVENALQTRFRKHPAWFQLDPSMAPKAILYDMPSTLTGLEDAIVHILKKGFYGRTKMQEIIEQRELNNFRRVLQMQIDESPWAQQKVEIIDEFV
jgi:hypothetical protein